MLTDEEFALLKSIPDVTDHREIDGNLLRLVCEASFSEDEYNAYNMTAWMRAWHHADYLNEKHYEDHISFCVVKSCQVSYVLDKQIARRYKLIP